MLQDVRTGRICDKSWRLLQERVLGVEREGGVLRQKFTPNNDPRLTRPPFSSNRVQYIVHRHVIRVSQFFHNVMRASMAAGKRVYLVMAADSVKPVDDVLFTDKVRRDVLQMANSRLIHHLLGIRLFFIGMQLLLFSKKMRTFGFHEWLQVHVGRHHLFENEQLPHHVEAGDVTLLRFVPTALFLRAEAVKWILPTSQLLDLPLQAARHK